MSKKRATLTILECEGLPIYRQLQLEEALLRADTRNICLLNHGSPAAIVMGISAKPKEVVNLAAHCKNPITLIQRFSGGGTVVVDANTLFITFIGHTNLIGKNAFPQEILHWTKPFYAPLFNNKFSIRENDYVLGEKKFGGNAQYIRKERFLHHSTLLWDYNPSLMNLLQIPPKMPNYRNLRPHHEFLCSLKQEHPCKIEFLQRFKQELEKYFCIEKVTLNDVCEALNRPHRKSLKLL